ncbi:MAG: T9SS type A sorting domain-containing protein [Bacteroidota bacterium]|nr:T9SS type A sorting domain-containing protein [Bacteroidota bacterium]
MCIEKKLLLYFILTLTVSLEALAQVPTTDMPAYQNKEINTKNLVEIYPNPTVDFLHVEIKESELVNVGFEMYNIIGNNIKVSYEQIGQSLYKIPVKDLANGYYMLIVKDDETRYRKAFKFMKI